MGGLSCFFPLRMVEKHLLLRSVRQHSNAINAAAAVACIGKPLPTAVCVTDVAMVGIYLVTIQLFTVSKKGRVGGVR